MQRYIIHEEARDMGSDHRVTIKDIAQEAGCSFSAVAKVLNGVRGNVRVGPELRARVEAIATKRGYAPNYGAQVLSRGRADTIGLLLWNVRTAFWGQLLEGAYLRLRESGQQVLALWPEPSEDPFMEAVELLRQGRVESLILVGELSPADLEAAQGSVIRDRLVAAWSPGGSGLTEVVVDHAPGVREAVAHLAELGHRSLVYSMESGAQRHAWAAERWETVQEAAATYRVDCRCVNVDRLPSQLAGATAVMALDDPTAFKIMGRLREGGLKIPGDVSLIGYDDVHAHLAAPPLTTIHYGLDEIGRAAAELAVQLGEDGAPGKTAKVASRLVVRSSTATPHERRRGA